jgi:hypothetical protein
MNKKSFLKILAVVIFFISFVLVILIYNKTKETNIIRYDDKIDEDANFINSNNSNNFNYSANVIINGIKENPGFISLQLIIDISPKTDIVYKNLLVTAFMDNIMDFLVVKTYSYFGTDISDKQLLDRNSQSNKGLSIAKGTPLYEDVNIDMLTDQLKEGIKVKISWADSNEYVIITKENINIDIRK